MQLSDSWTFPHEVFKDFDFENNSKRYRFIKNELLPEELNDHENISYITKGIVVLYWKNENRTKTIVDFKGAGEVLRPAVEVSEKRVGKIYFQAFTDTEILMMGRVFLCSCASESSLASDFFFGILRDDISSTYRQLRLLKEANLEKRYEMFLEEYRHIYNKISDRMIANYLGVHFTTLSRMKMRIFNSEKKVGKNLQNGL